MFSLVSCNLRPERIKATLKKTGEIPGNPTIYSDSADDWKKICDREDIDLIYISTPWDSHATMAIYAMENNKHVAIEVPAAKTMEECWQLVETSEKTKKHCVILENCCYDFLNC